MKLAVIIPALDEEEALPRVLEDLLRVLQGPELAAMTVHHGQVIVADNGSRDQTTQAAELYGVKVVRAAPRGYGSACAAGIDALPPDADIVVFMDGDYSDFAEDLPSLVAPIRDRRADFVIGTRRPVMKGALTPQQRFGNALACGLMRLRYGHCYTDLGPFRAIRKSSLDLMKMDDRGYGWTIEMQIKAIRLGLRIVEVPVRYRARIGHSKISGTLVGSWRAGNAILRTLAKY